MRVLNALKTNYVLILILIFGTILRFYNLNFQSYWIDEIHTLNDADPAKSFSEVFSSILIADPFPPLYFYIVHYLFIIFGYTIFVARMFSAILGIAAIFSLYKLGKELVNKKVGLIAAFLITINDFHIYYSQEARPYTLLLLFTTVSFLYLIKFIKEPTKKSAILYGVFTSLMLCGHFFALFALLSQMLIISFFFIILPKKKKRQYFINSIISGIIIALLFIPSIKGFIAASEIKTFWTPTPSNDVFTLIFKEFFGNSEIILYFIGFFLILYVIKLSKVKFQKITYDSIIENKTLFSFIILSFWIVFIIIVPLIRSYISVPMITTRYFINILPAIIIIISIGFNQIKNQIIKFFFKIVFLSFALTNIIVVKKYYSTTVKTQLREVSEFIISKNKNNDLIASSIPWYLSFPLNNKVNNYNLVDTNLDLHVQNMIQDSTKRKPFWYVDAHLKPYNVTPETQQYLDKNFIVDENIDLFDAWTKHYAFISDKPKILNLSKYYPFKERNGDNINFYIESFIVNKEEIKITGFSYLENQDSKNSSIDIVFINEKVVQTFYTEKIRREDITGYFKSSFDLSNSGFSSVISLKNVKAGNYKIGIYITNKKQKDEGLILTDKAFEKKE